MDKCYQATWGSRICLLFFGVPCVALFVFTGIEFVKQNNIFVGVLFVALTLLTAMWLTFLLTMRVEMNDRSIVRSSLFGSKVVPIDEIKTLRWDSGRGQLILSIVYGEKRRFITLSSIVVLDEKLRGIQTDILALRGLEGEALFPPMASYVDIEKMVERKH
ncbi:MAG: hypothetical protein WAM90_16055 [Rhodanobacter sp.]